MCTGKIKDSTGEERCSRGGEARLKERRYGSVGIKVYRREILRPVKVADELVGFETVFFILVEGVEDGATVGAISLQIDLFGGLEATKRRW